MGVYPTEGLLSSVGGTVIPPLVPSAIPPVVSSVVSPVVLQQV